MKGVSDETNMYCSPSNDLLPSLLGDLIGISVP